MGGTVRIIQCDNLKTGVVKNTRAEVVLNKSYQEMAEHYNACVIPCRVRAPKDKGHPKHSAHERHAFSFLVRRDPLVHQPWLRLLYRARKPIAFFRISFARRSSSTSFSNRRTFASALSLGFKSEKADGSFRYVWLFKGRATPITETFHTKEGKSVTRQTGKIEWVFLKRTHDNQYQVVADVGQNGFTETMAATFLQSVYQAVFTP